MKSVNANSLNKPGYLILQSVKLGSFVLSELQLPRSYLIHAMLYLNSNYTGQFYTSEHFLLASSLLGKTFYTNCPSYVLFRVPLNLALEFKYHNYFQFINILLENDIYYLCVNSVSA